MSIALVDGKICFIRLSLLADEVPGLLERHSKNYPGASTCEQIGAAMIAGGIVPTDAAAFVEKVVRWGGGQRFVGRLLSQNTPTDIADALRSAKSSLSAGRAAAAVTRLQKLRYLGQSFASKGLRCKVFGSVGMSSDRQD